MPKDSKLYIDDILEAIEKVERYTKNLSYQQFSKSDIITDAVIRNLAIIGEAVKNIPPELRKKYPEIEWKKIAGLRDILIHQYSGINLEIIWDILVNKLSPLKEAAKEIMKNGK